mmetsp:Transcript_63669/g.176560  ORF Transcript_63669/g.176560 Transcript_63669/m.176560 type:complete len:259 (-) Transcript_63669:598-1374(-)
MARGHNAEASSAGRCRRAPRVGRSAQQNSCALHQPDRASSQVFRQGRELQCDAVLPGSWPALLRERCRLGRMPWELHRGGPLGGWAGLPGPLGLRVGGNQVSDVDDPTLECPLAVQPRPGRELQHMPIQGRKEACAASKQNRGARRGGHRAGPELGSAPQPLGVWAQGLGAGQRPVRRVQPRPMGLSSSGLRARVESREIWRWLPQRQERHPRLCRCTCQAASEGAPLPEAVRSGAPRPAHANYRGPRHRVLCLWCST